MVVLNALGFYMVKTTPFAIRYFRNAERGLELKCVPQVFLGSSLETRRSAIGQLCPLSLVTVS